MKLTTLLNEMTEEQLIKKANDVYKFSKKGTFHKVFAGIDYSRHTNLSAYLHNNGLEAGTEGRHTYKSAIIARFLITL
jgi:hypothetical protein